MSAPFAISRSRAVAPLVAVALVQTIASIAVARGVHGTIDGTWPATVAIPIIAALAIAAYGLEVVQRRLCDGIGLAHAARVREALFRHLLRVRPEIVQRRREGAMLQSFVGDLTARRQWVSEGVMRAIVAGITLAGLTLWTGFTSGYLALAFLAASLAAALAGAMLLRALDTATKEVRKARGRVSALAAERLAVTTTIAAFGRQASETGRLTRRVDRLNQASYRRAWLVGALRGLPHLATSALLVFLAASHRAQSVGAITANVMLIGFLGIALRDLARSGELWISGRISRQRIEGLLALSTIPERGERKRRKRRRSETGQLVLDRLVIKRRIPPLTASAAAGSLILLDAPPDVRARLVWVLAGLHPAASGAIRWNGTELADMSPGRRRRTIGLCSPQFPLMRGSVAMNLRYRRPDAAARRIAEEADAWGLELKATEADPSALALARAMLGSPPVLLLELSDSLLDMRVVNRLRAVLPGYPGVVLLVTTRPELRALASELWQIGADGLTTSPLPQAAATLALLPPTPIAKTSP